MPFWNYLQTHVYNNDNFVICLLRQICMFYHQTLINIIQIIYQINYRLYVYSLHCSPKPKVTFRQTNSALIAHPQKYYSLHYGIKIIEILSRLNLLNVLFFFAFWNQATHAASVTTLHKNQLNWIIIIIKQLFIYFKIPSCVVIIILLRQCPCCGHCHKLLRWLLQNGENIK